MEDASLLSLSITPPDGRAGARATVTANRTMTVSELKGIISPLLKVRANNTVLCYNNGYLELDATLEEYDIPNGATLIYYVRLCGPLPVDTDWSLAGFTKLQRITKKRGI
jgi:hypothetical protein